MVKNKKSGIADHMAYRDITEFVNHAPARVPEFASAWLGADYVTVRLKFTC